MTRPPGFSIVSSWLGLPVMDQPFRCTTPWCILQSRTKLSRSVPPPSFHGTMWWTAAKVAFEQPGNRQCRSRRMTSLRWASVGKRPGPALVHGVADVVVDPDGDGGVTGDPPHHLAIDQSVDARARRRAPWIGPHRRPERPGGHGRPRSTGWPSCRCPTMSGSSSGRRRSSAGPRESRRQRGSPWPGPRSHSWSRHRNRGELDRNRPERVVEAQEAAIVLLGARSPLRDGAPCAGHFGQLSHRAFPCGVEELTFGLGRGRIGHGAQLVEGDLAPAERGPSRFGKSPDFSATCDSARAVGTETPKRSTAQDSVDVAPSSRNVSCRWASASFSMMRPSTAFRMRKRSSRLASWRSA